MSPLYTLVLAYFMLKERIACFEIAMIVITVCGIFEVVIFADSDDDTSGDSYS